MSDNVGAIDVGRSNLDFARALVESLHKSGVAAAFLCPGSRSTPLALALAERPGLLQGVQVDERGAAFQALGYAKAVGRPVVLLCTSGTAGANFLPAVAEACHARVPLVVLTADRPPELRAWGAPQTMEQRFLYAGFTRWSEEAPCPGERRGEIPYASALGRRAVAAASGAVPGPVHLNLPFREPLLPAVVDTQGFVQPDPRAEVPGPGGDRDAGAGPQRHPGSAPGGGPVCEPSWEPGRELAHELGCRLGRATRGVLVFGPGTWDPSLAAAADSLARALGWPVLADPASGLRAGDALDGGLIHAADLLLRSAVVAKALRPDLVVRFGGPSTSKAVNEWIARHESAELWLVDEAGGFQDPQHRATRSIRANARPFCTLAAAAAAATSSAVEPGVADSSAAMPGARAGSWLGTWEHADRVARAASDAALAAEQRFLVPHLADELWRQVPAGAALYVANSMAIREIDAFAGPRSDALRVMGNRGVNGIDGLVSSALGAASALGVPTVLWCGDIALLHDVAGLLAGSMQQADLTIVVANDDGGGIFEYLPAARTVPRPLFERVFATPHGLDLCGLARGLGWNAECVQSVPAFRAALSRALKGGRHVIEVKVDRAVNTAFHLSLHAAVGAALDREITG
ncbi:MAG: 2-succinyl-5-enolpyruvyl-6-hydroxy-3-cyclohexene-1-carboxylic-acid synthase [Steroidobacteraceae bacterium]|nr:2-succinyl-5-enolpyruvyl-6-hydroxy-3-cyclohexene-1-carboxylic-acid synthase [Steroidobacteraceae bacterium]